MKPSGGLGRYGEARSCVTLEGTSLMWLSASGSEKRRRPVGRGASSYSYGVFLKPLATATSVFKEGLPCIVC